MKQLLSFLFLLSILNPLNAQDKAEALSETPVNQKPARIICSHVSDNSRNYLFVIDGVVKTNANSDVLNEFDPKEIVNIEILKDVPSSFCYANYDAVILINTKKYRSELKVPIEKPFKIYNIGNKDWSTLQDVYNGITSQVPGVTITTNVDGIAKISMRGDTNAKVFVDGVRYDASILQTLNPFDIEKVEVSNTSTNRNFF